MVFISMSNEGERQEIKDETHEFQDEEDESEEDDQDLDDEE